MSKVYVPEGWTLRKKWRGPHGREIPVWVFSNKVLGVSKGYSGWQCKNRKEATRCLEVWIEDGMPTGGAA